MRTCHGIPQLECAIPATTDEHLTVGAKFYTEDCSGMSGERLLKCTSANVPQTDGRIPARTGKELTVGTEVYTSNRIGMSGERLLML